MRFKQTIENVLDEDKSLAEQICTLSHGQCILIVSILTDLSMTISLIALAITSIFGGKGGFAASGLSPQTYEGFLKKWFKQVSRCPQRSCWEVGG